MRLFGAPDVTEPEAFRRWAMRVIALISAGNSTFLVISSLTGLLPLPNVAVFSNMIYAVAMLAIGYAVKRYPERLEAVVWVAFIFMVLQSVVVDFTVTEDPMRFTWHFTAIGGMFIVGGNRAGTAMIVTSAVTTVWAAQVTGNVPPIGLVSLCLSYAVTGIALSVIMGRYERTIGWLNVSRDDLARLARTDALTGVSNRAVFEQELETALDGTARFSIILCDLDRFKTINDRHGHGAGDLVLQMAARALEGAVRPGDMLARIGGEEFCLLLRGVDPDVAVTRIEEIRRTLEAQTVLWEGEAIRVTASFGLTYSAPPHRDRRALLTAADAALYAAKDAGRNCHRISA